MFVLVDSFEIYQARSVLVGWAVGVGAAVSSVPAQTNGRFRIRKHEHRKRARTKARTNAEKQNIFFSQRRFNETIKGGVLDSNPQPGCGSALCLTVLAASTPQFVLEVQKHLA